MARRSPTSHPILPPLMVVATKGPPATPVTLVTPADVRIDSQQLA